MIIAIIPAKSDSARLPNKNMALIEGKPLLYHTIKAAKQCKLIDKIYVSTDSADIVEFARKQAVSVIRRPAQFCGEVPLAEVYLHALNNITEKGVSLIVGLQPDHPDRTVDLDTTIKYALEKDLDDLISVDVQGNKNGSIRIMKTEALRERRISLIAGAMMDKATNVHTFEDLRLAELRLKTKASPLTIRVKNKVISRQSPAFIIAEGACNHMCDIVLAKKMIDQASDAGADAIKFQTYKAEKLVAKDARTYWNYGSTKSQYEYYKNLDKFSKDDYKILFDYAKNKDLLVFSSPFDIENADMLDELGMPLFKIASCLIPDQRLIRHIAKFNKPVILSTGGSQLDEIKEAVQTVYAEKNYSLVILACTLSYPTKDKDADLLRIRSLNELFPEAIIGYSDHTEPDENMIIPSLAASLGAKVIEKHFTLDRSMTGSGHSFSVDPLQLKKMVRNIRLAEQLMGDGKLTVQEAEKKTRDSARMSIVAKQAIAKDQTITENMLTSKRPGTGISQRFIDEVVGKKALCDIDANSPIKWEYIR